MREAVARLSAALEGRYRIERELGEGGMATVYLAQDLKHDRRVAIKVLKPELAAVIGGERFVSEIRTTASLQHPHILPLFDSGSDGGFLYYVMPYVEGESLRERLDREKQLPVDEAVRTASAVASALHYAHERGVVHRDIKPANILIHAGQPVVADFGIAVAISAAGGGRLTETGMSVGTPHYMSPEQASADRDVSPRSDVYSLACVLYEMLAGEPPHTGSTAQAVLMRILTEEPRTISEVRKAVPANVRDAIARALEKLPADRFDSAEAFRAALEDERYRYGGSAAASGRGAKTGAGGVRWARDGRTLALVGVNLLLLLGLAWALTSAEEGAPAAPAHRFLVEDSLFDRFVLDISRHGDVVYAVTIRGRSSLRLRRALETASTPIPDTDDVSAASFSPDGEWVVFVRGDDEVVKTQLATGTSVTLVQEGTIPGLYTADWGDGGTIVLAGQAGVHLLPDVGGQPERLTGDPGVFARLVPGGGAVLHTVMPELDPRQARVVLYDLETGDTTTLAQSGGNAVSLPDGTVLYGHPSGTLFAIPVDLGARRATGSPVPVQEGVSTLGNISFYAVSPTGALAYAHGGPLARSTNDIELAWLGLDGEFSVLPMEPTDHGDVRLSPDATRIAYTRNDQIWIYDLERGTQQRLTFEGSNHHNPVWSPDGRRLVFSSLREDSRGGNDLYVKDVDGRSPAEWLGGTDGEQFGAAWLADGTILMVTREAPGIQSDILRLEAGGDGEPTPLLAADWLESSPSPSPDGRFMAYSSEETGERHLFVRELPGMGGRWQVSDEPVEGPSVWSPSGDALYYEAGETGALLRVDVELEPGLRVVRRTVLHDEGLVDQIADIHPDGSRLLVTRSTNVVSDTGQDGSRLVVVTNWLTELDRRLGGGRGG